MTTYEAREAAWREWAGIDHTHAVARTAFDAGWNARGRYDVQRIAVLEAALRQIARMPTGYPTRMVIAMEAIARRALGQSEEVNP